MDAQTPDFIINRGKGPVWAFRPQGAANKVWTGLKLSSFGFTSATDGVSRIISKRATAELALLAIKADGLSVEGVL